MTYATSDLVYPFGALNVLPRVVRVSAKELTALILDEERLRTERQDRKIWKSRVTGIEEFGPPHALGEAAPPPRRRGDRRERRTDEEDTEYRLAIEASKYEAEEEQKRRERRSSVPNDDDLAKAIKLSKEEEELRKRELEESNASAFFDDIPAASTQPQPTGYNQGYQQQGAVDWDGNTIDQHQPQQQLALQQSTATGYLNNAYSNPTGGFSDQQQAGHQRTNGPANGYLISPAVFDQQQIQPRLQQENPVQTQLAASNQSNNPYAQAGYNLSGSNYAQPAGFLPAGSNNPWATQQNESILAQRPLPTGSNNPFASSLIQPSPHSTNFDTSYRTMAEPKVQSQFNNHHFNPAASLSAIPGREPKEQHPQHARLNALLATGEGMDTFGNTGELRIPAQHTAPGTFVNSAGQNLSRLTQDRTGSVNNPFIQHQHQHQHQHQFTGVPQNMGLDNHNNYRDQSRLVPAQTGPANFGGSAFGGGTRAGTNNPFGQGSAPQQPQTGSLIDL